MVYRHVLQRTKATGSAGLAFRAVVHAALLECLLVNATSVLAASSSQTDHPSPVLHANERVLIEHPGETIDLFTGTVRHHSVDIEIPGNGGFALKVERHYAVQNADEYAQQTGLFWTIGFGRLRGAGTCIDQFGTAGRYTFEMPDGKSHVFYKAGYNIPGLTAADVTAPPAYLSPTNWRLDCLSGDFAITSPEGTRYELGQVRFPLTTGEFANYPTRIRDKHGNHLELSYDTTGQNGLTRAPLLLSVAADDGRKVALEYTKVAPLLMTKIRTSDGREWNYRYQQMVNEQGIAGGPYQLSEVVRPDGASWKYEYYPSVMVTVGNMLADNVSNSRRLRKVTYPEGGSIEYGYTVSPPGLGFWTSLVWFTVLKTKTTSDGGRWEFSFAINQPKNALDTAIVKTGNKTLVSRHHGYLSIANRWADCWKIGLLDSETTSESTAASVPIESRKLNWTAGADVFDSSATFLVPYVQASCRAKRPQLAETSVTREGSTYSTVASDFDVFGNPGTTTEAGNGPIRITKRNYCYGRSIAKWVLGQPTSERADAGTMGNGDISRAYDADCVSVLSENRFGAESRWTWHPDGSLASHTNPRGFTTTYADYFRGVARSELQPEGIAIARTVGDDGCLLTETNGEGRTTAYTCDALGRRTSIVPPTGNSTSITWTPNSATSLRGNYVEVTSYDGFGRTIQNEMGTAMLTENGWVMDGKIVKTFKYDPYGRKTEESNPQYGAAGLSGKRSTYDILDRVLTEQAVDSAGLVLAAQSYKYLTGNAIEVTDELGRVTRYDNLSFGNPGKSFLMGVTPPSVTDAKITVARNFLGQATNIRQGTLERKYEYNDKFHLVKVTNPETGDTVYGRDDMGNMTARQVGTSSPVTYEYDGQNRLIRASHLDFDGSPIEVNKYYTKTNKLLAVDTSKVVRRAFTYDENDNVVSEELHNYQYGPYTAYYGYDGNDHLASITYPFSNSTVTYSPDTFGRPTKVDSNNGAHVTAVSYWPSGQVRQIDYANGTTSSYGQNDRLWPSSFTTQKGLVAYNSSTYLYDSVGNLTSIADSADPTYRRALVFDSLNRVVKANGPWGVGEIDYDAVGNIARQQFGSTELRYAYDSSNRLARVWRPAAIDYSYDTLGNIAGDGTTTFRYDGMSNLRRAESGPITSYDYDGLNQRVHVWTSEGPKVEFYGLGSKLLSEWRPASDVGPGVDYFYLGGKRIAQRNATFDRGH